jgi:hypothetical protein
MTAHPSAVGLPEFLRRLFWDYDAMRLAPDADRALIMLRVMEAGDQAAIRWVRARYGDAALTEFVEQRHGRGLSEKRLRYWALLLGWPKPVVDGWLIALRRNPWYTRVQR